LEGNLFFYFLGLADSSVLKDQQWAVRFAGLYSGEDDETPNFDKSKQLMRSPITGSKGPRFHMSAVKQLVGSDELNQFWFDGDGRYGRNGTFRCAF